MCFKLKLPLTLEKVKIQNKKIVKLLLASTSTEHIEMREKRSSSHKMGWREYNLSTRIKYFEY